MDIVVWLRSLGLEQYEAAFCENAIDFSVLPDVTDHRSDRLQFRCTRTAGAICVRTVRNRPGIGFQGLRYCATFQARAQIHPSGRCWATAAKYCATYPGGFG
jgi:hypothetical protein